MMRNISQSGSFPLMERDVPGDAVTRGQWPLSPGKPTRLFRQQDAKGRLVPAKSGNAVMETEAMEDSFINELQEAMIQVDHRSMIIFVNPAWKTCTGYSVEESLHQDLSLFFPGPTGKALSIAVQRLLKGELEFFTGKGLVVQHKSGGSRTLNYHFFRRLSGKSDITVTGFLSEVTGTRELEELLSNQRYAGEMKTALIHMVSHELRTPFAIIQSSAEILGMMQQQRQAPDGDLISSHASSILQEISHVTEILNRMVMFSRIESGVLPGSSEAIDVQSFVIKLLATGYTPWKDGRSVRLTVAGTPKMARIDHVMLGLVIRNLLDNACKYSPGKRSPIVRVRFLQNAWSLSVRDFGIGIPAADQERLFKPFSRASNVGGFAGMGLGLMIVDYIVKNYQGVLQMRSKEGLGTTFTIRFQY